MDDFKFTIDLLKKFFDQPKIQQSLTLIHNHDVTGWEIWLQVELATFISYFYSNEVEIQREVEFFVDRRKTKKRITIVADFVLRRKGYSKEKYIILEIKQNKNIKICLNNMLNDVSKIANIRSSEIDIRAFWVVGIHPKKDMTKAQIKMFIKDKSTEDELFCVNNDQIDTRYIPNTNFAFTVF